MNSTWNRVFGSTKKINSAKQLEKQSICKIIKIGLSVFERGENLLQNDILHTILS